MILNPPSPSLYSSIEPDSAVSRETTTPAPYPSGDSSVPRETTILASGSSENTLRAETAENEGGRKAPNMESIS